MKFNQNLSCLFISLALVQSNSFAANEVVKPIVPSNHIDLFNGKDLSGWTAFTTNTNPMSTWSADGGVIKCTGTPLGYIRTDKDYRDYKLTVEWRFTKIATNADNGGFFVNLQLPDKMWPVSIQCQGRHNDIGDIIFSGGSTSKNHPGSNPSELIKKRGDSAEKPVGEWNTLEMVCNGDAVKMFLNGRLMNEITGCNVSSGKIGFQSEGAAYEIRKVFIEPLKL